MLIREEWDDFPTASLHACAVAIKAIRWAQRAVSSSARFISIACRLNSAAIEKFPSGDSNLDVVTGIILCTMAVFAGQLGACL